MSEEGPTGTRVDLTRKTGFAVLTQLTTAALTAVVTLFLVRALDPASFGNFSLAFSIVGLLYIPANLGIAEAAGRLMAESVEDRARLAHVFRRALVQKLLIAGALSLAMFAFAEPIAGLFRAEGLTGPMRAMSLALFGQAMFALPDRIFVALGQIRSRFLNVLQESAVEAAGTIGLVIAGLGATGAALGRGIGYTAGAVVGVVILVRHLGGRRLLTLADEATERAPLLQFALPLFVFTVIYAAFVQVDAIVIGLLKDSTAVGLFQAPVRIVTFLGFIGLAVASTVSPRFATPQGRAKDGPLLGQALRALVLAHMAVVPFMVVWATPLLELVLGPDYRESAPVLQALAPFVVMLGVGPLITTTLHFGGDLPMIRRRVPIAIAALAINIVIDLLLVPAMGIVGAAIGTSVAFFVYLVPHFALVRTIVPGFSLRPPGAALLRSAVAAAGASVIPLSLGTESVSTPLLIAGMPVALVVYLTLLVALGEVTVDELRTGHSWIRRRLGA